MLLLKGAEGGTACVRVVFSSIDTLFKLQVLDVMCTACFQTCICACDREILCLTQNRMLVMMPFVPANSHNSLTSELDEFDGKALVMSRHARSHHIVSLLCFIINFK